VAIKNEQGMIVDDKRALLDNNDVGSGSGQRDVVETPRATDRLTTTAVPTVPTTQTAANRFATTSVSERDQENTRFETDNAFDFGDTTTGGTKRDPSLPDWGAGGPTLPPPPGVIPPDTDEPAPVEPGAPLGTRATIQQMLDDPTATLADKDLEQTYTEQQIEDGEIQDPTRNQLGDIGDIEAQTTNLAGPITAAPGVEAQQGVLSPEVVAASMSAALIDPASLTKAVDEIEKINPMQAASMSQHLDELLDGMEDGNVPLWARPAVSKVEQMLASRGISASSVGRDSLFNAIIQAAMPIAQQDASFEQEAYKTNYQAKVNAVMSDVSMEFAAKQFNATSKNQAAQFNAQMKTQVALQNAARADAMSQFNAQMKTQADLQTASRLDAMSQFNIQTQTQADLQTASRLDAMSQFNVQAEQAGQQFNAAQVNAMTQMTVQLQSQRDQFNSQMASQIEQSNVNWRRQVNQINTAGINAVNQANVQNAFNLSNQALTFLWQEMRDEAHWEFQATEAEKDRKNQLEASILANETALGGEIGILIENLINGGNFLKSFFSSWG